MLIFKNYDIYCYYYFFFVGQRINSTSSLPPSLPPVTIPLPGAGTVEPHQDDDAASTISSETHRDHPGEEGEETETAPEGEGDEDGITRCIW